MSRDASTSTCRVRSPSASSGRASRDTTGTGWPARTPSATASSSAMHAATGMPPTGRRKVSAPSSSSAVANAATAMAKIAYVGEPVGFAIGSSAQATISAVSVQRPCRALFVAAHASQSGSTGRWEAIAAADTIAVNRAAARPAAPRHAREAVHAARHPAISDPTMFTSLVR